MEEAAGYNLLTSGPLSALCGRPARVYRTSGVGVEADIGAPPPTQPSFLRDTTWPRRKFIPVEWFHPAR